MKNRPSVHGMNAEWSRAYPPSTGRWVVIAWEAAGLTYLHWTTVRLFTLGDATGWLLAAALAVTWAAGSWQVARMGLYLSDAALRIRGVFRTRTIPWPSIAAVTVEDVTYRAGPLPVPAGRTVMLTLRDGTRLNTAMWRRGMDFHNRPQMFHSVCQELPSRL